jgi:hypothetical protein
MRTAGTILTSAGGRTTEESIVPLYSIYIGILHKVGNTPPQSVDQEEIRKRKRKKEKGKGYITRERKNG